MSMPPFRLTFTRRTGLDARMVSAVRSSLPACVLSSPDASNSNGPSAACAPCTSTERANVWEGLGTVDDLGYAASDSSDVVGDTVRFRTSCQASGGRTCFAYTSIMVRSRSDDIRFQVRIEVEGKEWSRFELIVIRQ
jgi:hypothetical protein